MLGQLLLETARGKRKVRHIGQDRILEIGRSLAERVRPDVEKIRQENSLRRRLWIGRTDRAYRLSLRLEN